MPLYSTRSSAWVTTSYAFNAEGLKHVWFFSVRVRLCFVVAQNMYLPIHQLSYRCTAAINCKPPLCLLRKQLHLAHSNDLPARAFTPRNDRGAFTVWPGNFSHFCFRHRVRFLGFRPFSPKIARDVFNTHTGTYRPYTHCYGVCLPHY